MMQPQMKVAGRGSTELIVRDAMQRLQRNAWRGLLASESPNGYRFADFGVRATGLGLVVTGTALAAIAGFAFRQHRLWAWWVMWVLPIWGISALVLILAIGVSPAQAPPTPMITGPIVAVVSAALLLVSAPRFLGRHTAD